ncbi:Mbov_0400 family ICE element protein [Mycoplasma sp. 'Moose RK']|uniref:Mbov_0400 family ICE element protein n=1 Tax=Mycoplasma sp. 'Moose RK' TaxID=2780095 RepID=UPI0018C23D0B|nr:hypothetical protein [Mycoplasma sp. 'Moose RK']MBG0730760.1 hypothetical protein [Mycoplasma sp. 'Moose RK']
MLNKFVPFKVNRTLVFDSLGRKIKSRPVIIFYDSTENNYYYIKARDARTDNGELKDKFKGEVFIPKSDKPNTLFTKDSYLDCSQIFYIRDNELEELTRKYSDTEILDSKELEFSQVEEIFDNIDKCLTSEPPYMVISKVSYDAKTRQTKSDVKYASKKHLSNDYNSRGFKTKKIRNQMKSLLNDKDDVYLEILETTLVDAWEDYRREKIYNPLFKWINENKFIQNGLNSKEIIQEYHKLSNPIVPEVVSGEIIHTCLVNNKWHNRSDFSLSDKLEETDFEFMIEWFDKNNLNINMRTFKEFRKAMKREWPQSYVFDFQELEFQLEEKLSKLEKEMDNKDQFINKENKQKNTNQLNHSNSVWDKAKQKPEEEKDKNKKKLKMKM